MKKKLFKYAHLTAHSSYLGAAALAGHGFYSYAAGALLLVVWAGVLAGEAVEA